MVLVSNCSNAISFRLSAARTTASKASCSGCLTVTSECPFTTCSLVRIKLGSISQPEPWPVDVPMKNTDGQLCRYTSLKLVDFCNAGVGGIETGVGVGGKVIGVAVG